MPESMEPYGSQICLSFAAFTLFVESLVFVACLSSTFLFGLKLFGTTTSLLRSSGTLFFLDPALLHCELGLKSAAFFGTTLLLFS